MGGAVGFVTVHSHETPIDEEGYHHGPPTYLSHSHSSSSSVWASPSSVYASEGHRVPQGPFDQLFARYIEHFRRLRSHSTVPDSHSTNITMRALVVLAVVGFSSAFIQDAPDVAAEKARFMASFQAAQQAAASAHRNVIPTHQAYNNQGHYQPHHHQGQYQPKWTGPVAATVPAGVNGAITPVGDTSDVSAARQAFFSAYQSQLAATAGAAPSHHHSGASHWQPAPAHQPHHGGHQYQAKWTGPVAATVPAGLPGSSPQVADTPEVQAAKASFFQTFQRQAAAAAPPSPVWG